MAETKVLAESLQTVLSDNQLGVIEDSIAKAKADPTIVRVEKKIDPEAIELAEKMYQYIVEIFPKAEKPVMEKWAVEFQAVKNKDKDFSYDVQMAVLNWIFKFDSRDAEFWRKNIRSGKTFKEKFLRILELARDELVASKTLEI
jgi:hypothetical protein